MTADKANATQWLAWVLMILTGSMNRRGGICPGTQSLMGEWPCAALPPALRVERHIERMGGWRLAPRVLVEQLAKLREPASLVLTPRRQMRRLNAQFDFLGDPADVLIHPEDGAASGVVDGKPVTVRSAHGHVEANVNGLTDKDDIDVIIGMVRYSGVPVSLHPVP